LRKQLELLFGFSIFSSQVDTAFFDKTGTITNEEMEFFNIDINPHGDKQLNLALIQIGMAVCHTIHVSTYGQKVGNCIDLMSFECTSASLIQRNGEMPEVQFEHQVYKTLRRFEFDSELATQSVIVGTRTGRRLVFVKGSADTIKHLSCKSTLPDSYDDIVRNAEVAGIYQLAMAYKDLTTENDIEGLQRFDVEKELSFCGFIQFQNAIKDEAPSVLRELKDGNIDISILTGDSVLTALAVARKCGLIAPNNTVIVGIKSDDLVLWKDVYSDEIIEAEVFESLCKSEGKAVLAITGEAWTFLQKESPSKIHSIASHIRVFGRCKPGDKVSIVSYFVEYGRTTLMCGDGQNDCGALKMAHVGISLSISEASVVSAFTSLDRKLTAVPEILREGRCALASAFASYKYYIIYGQVEAFLQVINAYLGISFAEWCWVFLDGLWSISMAYSLSLSKASKKLSNFCPTASLLSSRTLFSVCGILFINFSFIVIAFIALFNQEWFQCRKWNVKDVSNILIIGDNYEASVLFLVGGYQYISSAIALNFGYSHRQSWWSNYKFVFLAALWTAFVFMMTIYPSRFSCIWRVNCSNDVS
jgi:magnesium-transporting ATPase (P-type)